MNNYYVDATRSPRTKNNKRIKERMTSQTLKGDTLVWCETTWVECYRYIERFKGTNINERKESFAASKNHLQYHQYQQRQQKKQKQQRK